MAGLVGVVLGDEQQRWPRAFAEGPELGAGPTDVPSLVDLDSIPGDAR